MSPDGPGSSHRPSVGVPSSDRPINAPLEKSSPKALRSAVHALSTPDGSVISTQSAPVCVRSSSAWSRRFARSSVRTASPILLTYAGT